MDAMQRYGGGIGHGSIHRGHGRADPCHWLIISQRMGPGDGRRLLSPNPPLGGVPLPSRIVTAMKEYDRQDE